MVAQTTDKITFKKRMVNLGVGIKKNKEVYILLIVSVTWYAIFQYIPLYGLTMAFKTFKAGLGIFRSPWAGLINFRYLFRDPAFFTSVGRTLFINAGKLIFTFPIPIILALMLNELRVGRFKKILQTVYTFPHFISWIMVASIMLSFLGLNGLLNSFIALFGAERIAFLGTPSLFQPMLYLTAIWKGAGWSSIIYMAAIAGIDQEQYEAAEIDGATRFQRIRLITLPSIQGTFIVMLVLAVGNLMSDNFDQIFNLSNPATKNVAEVLDMYIYRVTFQSTTDFGFSTAVSLFKSVINFILIFTTDKIAKLIGGSGLFA